MSCYYNIQGKYVCVEHFAQTNHKYTFSFQLVYIDANDNFNLIASKSFVDVNTTPSSIMYMDLKSYDLLGKTMKLLVSDLTSYETDQKPLKLRFHINDGKQSIPISFHKDSNMTNRRVEVYVNNIYSIDLYFDI